MSRELRGKSKAVLAEYISRYFNFPENEIQINDLFETVKTVVGLEQEKTLKDYVHIDNVGL